MRGFGRSGDTSSTLARRARARRPGRRRRRPARRARPRPARPQIRDDRLRQRGNAGAADRRAARLPGRRFTLTGDESLSSRPMERVAEPLAADGRADRDDRRASAADGRPGRRSRRSSTSCPVASAQVKSAVLLAGLGADGQDDRRRAAPTRDHTELMLQDAGVRVTVRPSSVSASTRPSACGSGPSTCRATSPRPRRSSRRRRWFPSRASRSTTSTSIRGARGCSTCSSGWAAGSGSSAAADRRRAGRRPRGARVRS